MSGHTGLCTGNRVGRRPESWRPGGGSVESWGPCMLAGGVERGEQVRLELCFEGDPKVYEMAPCHPVHIYCAHPMRIQKRDHVIPVPIFSWGEYTQQNRPKYNRTRGYITRKRPGMTSHGRRHLVQVSKTAQESAKWAGSTGRSASWQSAPHCPAGGSERTGPDCGSPRHRCSCRCPEELV